MGRMRRRRPGARSCSSCWPTGRSPRRSRSTALRCGAGATRSTRSSPRRAAPRSAATSCSRSSTCRRHSKALSRSPSATRSARARGDTEARATCTRPCSSIPKARASSTRRRRSARTSTRSSPSSAARSPASTASACSSAVACARSGRPARSSCTRRSSARSTPRGCSTRARSSPGSLAAMTLVADLELPAFDHTDSSMRGERFHAAMEQLRATGWLAQTPYGYMVLDREAGEFFLRTRSAIFPGMKIAEIFGVSEGPLFEEMKRNILHINGADHSRLRSLVNPALSPRAVERYRPAMRGFLERLFDETVAAGAGEGEGEPAGASPGTTVACEFVESFAKPYPSLVIAEVMGAPLADAPRLHHWSNWIQRQFDAAGMANEREGIERAVEEFYEYAEGLLRLRREDPGDDLLSRLLAAEAEGERLSEQECINLVFNVLVGGVDTSQSQLSHAVRLLAEHPEQWQRLTEEPALAERAVEEALRYEPITPFTARILTEELTYRDVTFPADTIVMVCAFTGNRDVGEDGAEARDADRFDLTAADDGSERARGRVLTFGAGVHYCLGANLARLEMTEALTFLAEHVRAIELDGEPEFGTISGIYGLEELPLRLVL